jgi:hypothetical protein
LKTISDNSLAAVLQKSGKWFEKLDKKTIIISASLASLAIAQSKGLGLFARRAPLPKPVGFNSTVRATIGKLLKSGKNSVGSVLKSSKDATANLLKALRSRRAALAKVT